MHLDVSTFVPRDTLGALKVLEEAGELQVAYKAYCEVRAVNPPDLCGYRREQAEDELADVVTACCNLAQVAGFDLQAALDRCEAKNRERGRYDG